MSKNDNNGNYKRKIGSLSFWILCLVNAVNRLFIGLPFISTIFSIIAAVYCFQDYKETQAKFDFGFGIFFTIVGTACFIFDILLFAL